MQGSTVVTPTTGRCSTVFVAIELSQKTWLVTLHSPDRDRISRHKLTGGDHGGLLALIEQVRARAAGKLGAVPAVTSCYEAGYDGFWLHRLLEAAGIRNLVFDAASIAVEQRARRAKTDRIDGELRQHAKADPRVKVLTTLPGVGQFTALVILAEIGDITRFGSARKLASWAGLTPTVRGSDLKVRHGHISKQGSAWLRWVMNQAAQTAKRSPEFAATYAAITKRRGKKIATIAIARKLLTRAWHLLADMQAASTNEPPRRP